MKNLLDKLARLDAKLGGLGERCSPLVEKILNKLPESHGNTEYVDFSTDADAAILRQEPLRARLLLHLITGAVGVSVIWATFAQLDEVTRGDGKVIPSRQIQVLQSIDGGLVSEILVKERALRPPLAAVPGLGSAAAKSIVDSRTERPFSSQDDLRLRGHVSKSILELLRQQGCLDTLPESDQLRLFG